MIRRSLCLRLTGGRQRRSSSFRNSRSANGTLTAQQERAGQTALWNRGILSRRRGSHPQVSGSWATRQNDSAGRHTRVAPWDRNAPNNNSVPCYFKSITAIAGDWQEDDKSSSFQG